MTIYVSDKLQATAAPVSGEPTPSTSLQWLRNNSAIAGATSSEYILTAADAGANISVMQSAINMLGTAVANSASQGPVSAFTPALLFRNNVVGTWYDPSDTSTLFQNAAGITPVTAVEQPVGLMLDKSKGLTLGSELVTNGDFSNGTSGWTVGAGWSISSGIASSSVTNVSLFGGGFSSIAGKWYEVQFDVVSYTSGTLFVTVGGAFDSSKASFTGIGRKKAYLFGGTIPSRGVEFYGGGITCSLDNISVRELPGNHAFNSSGNSANFPVLSARYNLLTKSEDFSDVVWAKSAGYTTVTTNVATAPNNTVTADKLIANATNNPHLAYQSFNYSTGSYRLSIYAKSAEYSKFRVQGNSSTTGAFALFDLSNGTYSGLTLQGSGWTNITASMHGVGDGWYFCSITFDSSVSVNGQFYVTLLDNSGNSVFTGDGTSGIYIWGADLRVSNDGVNLPAYQRVNTSTDYDSSAVWPRYLRFNGTNQWLQTGSIDFTGTDKMFVSAGVRKLSDAARAIVTELGNNQLQAFKLEAPNSANPQYFWTSAGSAVGTASYVDAVVAAPVTNVLSGIGNISGDQAILRVNGTQAAISTADQGTGNYGNYPLYIGARAGSSLWFNGRLYSLITAGKLANAVEITETESYINSKTKAYA